MVASVPLPQPRTLLPPFIACLQTAGLSIRPPPALLPLLSPILRQRVQLFTSTATASEGQTHQRQVSWLSLLCWNEDVASKLPAIVEKYADKFEPHPVSGEIEMEAFDEGKMQYRRVDV